MVSAPRSLIERSAKLLLKKRVPVFVPYPSDMRAIKSRYVYRLVVKRRIEQSLGFLLFILDDVAQGQGGFFIGIDTQAR